MMSLAAGELKVLQTVNSLRREINVLTFRLPAAESHTWLNWLNLLEKSKELAGKHRTQTQFLSREPKAYVQIGKSCILIFGFHL